MWGAVLLFALIAMGEPVRIGAAVLLISRPRPMFNLFLFWLGGAIATIATGLAVLFILSDVIAAATDSVAAATADINVAPFQVGAGVLAIFAAFAIVVRSSARRGMPAVVVAGGQSVPPLETAATTSAFSRLSTRVQGVLQGESPWVAFGVGAWLGPGPPVELIAALTAIVASGAAASAQIGAVVLFTAVMLAFAEIPLLCHLVAPAKTEAAMMHLHTWVRDNRRRVWAIGLGILGAYLTLAGLGGV